MQAPACWVCPPTVGIRLIEILPTFPNCFFAVRTANAFGIFFGYARRNVALKELRGFPHRIKICGIPVEVFRDGVAVHRQSYDELHQPHNKHQARCGKNLSAFGDLRAPGRLHETEESIAIRICVEFERVWS